MQTCSSYGDLTGGCIILKVIIGDITELMINRSAYDGYYQKLSEYRRNKAEKFKRYEDRCRSVGAGFLLENALKEILLVEKIPQFSLTDKGKPYLVDYPGVFFNISHSGNRVMCTVADRPVGCDVEYIETNKKTTDKIARRFFSEAEQRYLCESSTSAFYDIWTLKESFLKCTGEGLYRDMSSFSVMKICENKYSIMGESGYSLRMLDCSDSFYRYSLCVKLDEKDADNRNYIVTDVKIFVL